MERRGARRGSTPINTSPIPGIQESTCLSWGEAGKEGGMQAFHNILAHTLVYGKAGAKSMAYRHQAICVRKKWGDADKVLKGGSQEKIQKSKRECRPKHLLLIIKFRRKERRNQFPQGRGGEVRGTRRQERRVSEITNSCISTRTK